MKWTETFQTEEKQDSAERDENVWRWDVGLQLCLKQTETVWSTETTRVKEKHADHAQMCLQSCV